MIATDGVFSMDGIVAVCHDATSPRATMRW